MFPVPETIATPRPPLEKITTDIDDLMAKLDASNTLIGESLIRYRLTVDYALALEAERNALKARLADFESIPGLDKVVEVFIYADATHGKDRDYRDATAPAHEYYDQLLAIRNCSTESWKRIIGEEFYEVLAAVSPLNKARECIDLAVAALAWHRAILRRLSVDPR